MYLLLFTGPATQKTDCVFFHKRGLDTGASTIHFEFYFLSNQHSRKLYITYVHTLCTHTLVLGPALKRHSVSRSRSLLGHRGRSIPPSSHPRTRPRIYYCHQHTPTHTQKTEHWSPDLHCLQLMALMAQMRKSICAPKRRAARPLSAHQLATAPRKLAKFGRWVVFVNVYVYVRFRHFLCQACRHTHWRCY